MTVVHHALHCGSDSAPTGTLELLLHASHFQLAAANGLKPHLTSIYITLAWIVNKAGGARWNVAGSTAINHDEGDACKQRVRTLLGFD